MGEKCWGSSLINGKGVGGKVLGSWWSCLISGKGLGEKCWGGELFGKWFVKLLQTCSNLMRNYPIIFDLVLVSLCDKW